MKTIHINSRAYIVLTEEGAAIWNTYGRKIGHPYLYAGAEISLQFWEVLKIFGPNIQAGQSPFFENGEIKFYD